MTDATASFFDDLGRRGHESLLAHVTGTIRFDLKDVKRTDHFIVAVQKGDITVSKANEDANCVVRADRALFDDFAKGESNMMTAFLRREVTFEGDPQLLVLFQRIFQVPQSSPEKTAAISEERRHA
jgi:putative sterol carrier protein